MKTSTLTLSFLGLGALVATLAFASDHREAPLIAEDLTADIADVYVFQSPTDPANTVLVLTVNPFSAPTQNSSYHFSPNVRYSIMVDNNGDAIEDVTAHFTFSDRSLSGGAQTFDVRMNDRLLMSGPVTAPTSEPNANAPIIIGGPKGSKAFAGQRDDPFFFDGVGFGKVLAGTGGFTGDDAFATYNVSAIVLEVPTAELGWTAGTPLQVWGETARKRHKLLRSDLGLLEISQGAWQQIDRAGNPAINSALIPLDLKDNFNIAEPSEDAALYAGTIVASLQALGTTQPNIDVLAAVAVPDTLKYDPAAMTSYPNGRGLADDTIDVLFTFIFNQTGVTDMVDANDATFLTGFPYLADPFQP
ncbi:MAG: hypothetical protein COA70_09390 [Planctomycetota bacterium]|nr:MAG: hypothetical protein COA70_09390 [Planctomycetota bacterium]